MTTKKNIAIIGTGISGLTCAYRLADKENITVFEASNYIGGHTHTVEVEKEAERSSIDTGFIVFNDRTYPEFIKLIKELGVSYQPTEMSFSTRNDALNLEYNGNNLNTLFAQRTNLFRPRFLRLVRDILRFNTDVRKQKYGAPGATLGKYLQEKKYSSIFTDNYLLPMVSAIWSMGVDNCLDFPLHFFIRFFDNHGLLDLTNRPRWYTIAGGSSSYIEPLTQAYRERIKLSTPVTRIERQENGVLVETPSKTFIFDEVILACHGDQALTLLSNPTTEEKAVLGAFQFIDNQVVLHTDTALLPKRKAAWASWNYRVDNSDNNRTTLTYNMNILQRLTKKHTYLVTLNQDIDEQHVLARFSYSHPVYTTAAIAAQQQWHTISGVKNIHYCGAYWLNGFHEDGVRSALRVAKNLEGNT